MTAPPVPPESRNPLVVPTRARTGFLEEAPGVRSSARLAALALVAAVCSVVTAAAFAIVYGAVHGTNESVSMLLGGATALVTPLLGGIWAALRERTTDG